MLGPTSEQRADDDSTQSDDAEEHNDIADNDKFEALSKASMKKKWEEVELLLKDGFKRNDMYKASYNALQNKFASSILHLAASKGYQAMTQLCLDNGEDIDFNDRNGWRALHFAAEGDHEATVQQLVNRGADKEARTNEGSTALHLAASNGHDSTAQLLIRNFGVDKTAKDSDGRTALFLLLRYM